MMLFDSKIPILPSGLNAAGTVPNGCAPMNALVLRSAIPLKPVWPICTSARTTSSLLDSGLASKSHSQDSSSFGEAPLTSISTPHKRAAIVAFQMRGFGKYEKIRSSLISYPCSRSRAQHLRRFSPCLPERPDLDVERPSAALLMCHVPHFLGDGCGGDEEFGRSIGKHLARPLEVDHRVDQELCEVHAFGPRSRAIASATIRCAALVGANPANRALPRSADVLPVTMMAPSPAATIPGARRRAR